MEEARSASGVGGIFWAVGGDGGRIPSTTVGVPFGGGREAGCGGAARIGSGWERGAYVDAAVAGVPWFDASGRGGSEDHGGAGVSGRVFCAVKWGAGTARRHFARVLGAVQFGAGAE